MPEVCILDTSIIDRIPSGYQAGTLSSQGMTDWAVGYFSYIESFDISTERCSKIISSSSEDLGEHDFMFQWFEKPTKRQLSKLEDDIEKVLSPLGCKAKVTNE